VPQADHLVDLGAAVDLERDGLGFRQDLDGRP
jgi:hypothetical protein